MFQNTTSKNKSLRTLVIDDQEPDRILLIEQLKKITEFEFNIEQANSVQTALEHMDSFKFDIIFLDYMLRDSDGLRLLMDLSENQKKGTSIVFVTGFANSIVKEDSYAFGAHAFIEKKNISKESLLDTIKKLV